jgi:flagellar biosynthesis protein FliP
MTMRASNVWRALGVSVLSAVPALALAQQAAPGLPLVVAQGAAGTSYSVPIQTLLFFTALSFLPALLLLMTGFTRIVIVLSLLRQALGTQAAPPNQVIIGLSLFLTFFVMSPTFDKVHDRRGLEAGRDPAARVHVEADAPGRRDAVRQARQAAQRDQT